jgi:hypothetical protein
MNSWECSPRTTQPIHTATLALAAIKAGHVGLSGSTGAILDYSLIRDEQSYRLSSPMCGESQNTVEHRPFPLADFIAEMKSPFSASRCGKSSSPSLRSTRKLCSTPTAIC